MHNTIMHALFNNKYVRDYKGADNIILGVGGGRGGGGVGGRRKGRGEPIMNTMSHAEY